MPKLIYEKIGEVNEKTVYSVTSQPTDEEVIAERDRADKVTQSLTNMSALLDKMIALLNDKKS